MAIQNVFRRYESKYLLNAAQKAAVLEAMRPYMALDQYGRTTICNLYFDTETYRLIRHSIEKPVYKEKLRLRSYGRAGGEDPVFVELKKKFDGVVYKRRIPLSSREAIPWLAGEAACPKPCQISREIDYFMNFYGALTPKVFLSYEREAYFCTDQPDFRVTLDENILCRQTDLTLDSDARGTPILPAGMTLLEIKCAGGIPLWMTRVLTELEIRKTSFSKYGTAYENLIFPKLTKEVKTNA